MSTGTDRGWRLPKIGLLSDSHGQSSTTRRGVDLLLARGAQLLIHLGDIGTAQVIDALAVESPAHGDRVETHLVFGNTDWDTAALGTYAQELGLFVDHPTGRITVETGELVYCHGHEPKLVSSALAQKVKYLCHGHTHEASDTHRGRTRVINPGSLYRAHTYSVAVLDTARDRVAFYSVAKG